MNKKNKYTKDQIRAYWIGVGISSAYHNESNALLESKNKKIRTAIHRGYSDDNSKNISKRFR